MFRNFGLVGWIVAFLLGAVYFSGVVALGPAPGGIKAERKDADAGSKKSGTEVAPAATQKKNQQPSAEDETYCDNSASRNECLVQLRAARASEEQARYALYGLVLIGVTVALTLGTVVAGFLTVWTMKDSSERQLRAYLFLDPAKEMTFVRRPSTAATMEVEIHVKNLGLTPAHEVVGESWVGVDVWPLPDAFNCVGPPGSGPVVKSVVAPGGSVHFHTGTARAFTQDDLSAIQSGQLRVYIFGRISYSDAFGKSRYTNFCYASTALGKDGFRTAIAKAHRHNDAD